MVELIINLKIINKSQMNLKILQSKKIPKSIEKGIQENPLKNRKFQID